MCIKAASSCQRATGPLVVGSHGQIRLSGAVSFLPAISLTCYQSQFNRSTQESTLRHFCSAHAEGNYGLILRSFFYSSAVDLTHRCDRITFVTDQCKSRSTGLCGDLMPGIKESCRTSHILSTLSQTAYCSFIRQCILGTCGLISGGHSVAQAHD